MRIPTLFSSCACILVLAQPLSAMPRTAFLDQPLVPAPQAAPGAALRFHCPAQEPGRQDDLAEAHPTMAPMFRVGLDRDPEPEYLFQFNFPQSFRRALPTPVRALVARSHVERVDILCAIQALPSEAEVPVEIRPELWAGPQAQLAADPSVWMNLYLGPAGDLPFRFQGRQLQGLDLRASSAFWTVIEAGDRVAATLHILVNDQDRKVLAEMALMPGAGDARGASGDPESLLDAKHQPPGAGRQRTLGLWLKTLNARAAVGELPWIHKLNELTRPLVDRKRVEGQDLVLTGSGFTDTAGVLVDGLITPFRVVDDGELRIPGDHRDAKDIQVGTPTWPIVPAQAAVHGPDPTEAQRAQVLDFDWRHAQAGHCDAALRVRSRCDFWRRLLTFVPYC